MPAKGRNIGGNAAKGEILAFIDSDAYPASDWLKAIARAYSEGCFAGGGCVEAPPFQLGTNIALSQLYLQFNEFLKSGERRKKFFIPSVNLFCNRELFLTLGGFPEIRASEDTLFGLKLTEQNNLWFDPSITVYHIFRTDFKPFLQNQKILGEYIIRYRKSYYNKFYYKSIFPILLLPIFLFIKVNSMLFRIVKAGKKHFFFFLKSSPLFILGMIYWSIGFLIGSFDRK
jgi:glycosyltransferase involved in cell wall biosynthesis